MAEHPAVEPLSTADMLRDLKAAIIKVKGERDEFKSLLEKVSEIQLQNETFVTEIDSARSRVFALLVEQVQKREIEHVEEYLTDIDDAIKVMNPPEKKT
jgi:hypothetical protein